MKNLKLSFRLDELPCYAISHKNGRKTFEMQAFDGEISVDLQYDYHRRPLRLSAKTNAGEKVDVILMPHRIELYVDGVLMDEEWPAGNRLLSLGDDIFGTVSVLVEEYHETVAVETVPDFIFLGSKITADGDCSHEIKMLTLWKESYDQPRQHIKKQRCYFADKSPSSQSYGFSSSHVWMRELDYKES